MPHCLFDEGKKWCKKFHGMSNHIFRGGTFEIQTNEINHFISDESFNERFIEG